MQHGSLTHHYCSPEGVSNLNTPERKQKWYLLDYSVHWNAVYFFGT
jgi:hypothetical protein